LFFGFLFGWIGEKFESKKKQKGRRTDPMRKTKNKKKEKKENTPRGRAAQNLTLFKALFRFCLL
jgi:hypothetical protein